MKALSISVSLGLALASCNMMAGLGEDMQQAGVNQRATEAKKNGTPDYGSERIYNAPQTMTYPTSPQPQNT